MFGIKQTFIKHHKLEYYNTIGQHHEIPRKQKWTYPGQDSNKKVKPKTKIMSALP